MALPPVIMHKLPFPVETKEAIAFWASDHLCNRVKAIISFSRNKEEALRLLRIYLPRKTHHFRERAWEAWRLWVEMPEMDKIPFSEMETPWWECIGRSVQPGPTGYWTLWDDATDWDEKPDESGEWQDWTVVTTLEETDAHDSNEGTKGAPN